RIGSWGAVWLAIGLALSLARRRARPFVLVLLADAAAWGLADALKAVVGEHRPHRYDPLMPMPHSSSFPSAHAAISFACATVLWTLVPRAAPLFVALAAAIAYSPLYVLAGAVLGVATALLLLSAARRR